MRTPSSFPKPPTISVTPPEETISLVQERNFVTGLQKKARTHKIAINFGIHEPGQKSPKKVRNMSIWIDEDGEIVQRYQKLHLFDINIEDGPRARASRFSCYPPLVLKGTSLLIFSTIERSIIAVAIMFSFFFNFPFTLCHHSSLAFCTSLSGVYTEEI